MKTDKKQFQNKLFRVASLLIIFLSFACTNADNTIITITVKSKNGNPQPDRKVYEFEYPATHQLGCSPFVANKFRLSDKSGKAVFILDDYEYDKTKATNTLYFTVFNEVSGNTYTVAGTIKVDFTVGKNTLANLIID